MTPLILSQSHLFIHLIRSNGWFIQEWSKWFFYEWSIESLGLFDLKRIITIRSISVWHQSTTRAIESRPLCMLLNRSHFLLTELLYKISITFALVWYCLTIWCKYETKTQTGTFLPHILNFSDILTTFSRLHRAVSCCPASYLSSISCMKCQMTHIYVWGGANAFFGIFLLLFCLSLFK